MKTIHVATPAIALALLFTGAGAESAKPAPAVAVAEIGHRVIGGEQVKLRESRRRPRIRASTLPAEEIDPNGDFSPGATYVHFTKLAKPRHPYRLLMLPGGGLSGAVYETTPDGRPGWEWFFLRSGYSVYVADLNQTGRSPWARFPEINPEEPRFRDQAFLWEVFRIGPPGSYASEHGPRPYANTQFPVQSFAAFAKLAAPRFRSDPATEDAMYDAMLQQVCPCVLLAHSASAPAGLAAAKRHPQLVKAVVVVEPSGVPDPPTTALPPHLVIWGDYLSPDETSPDWMQQYESSRRYLDAAAASNTKVTLMNLPELKIRGNSHLLMADANSDQVAKLIARWLQSHSL